MTVAVFLRCRSQRQQQLEAIRYLQELGLAISVANVCHLIGLADATDADLANG